MLNSIVAGYRVYIIHEGAVVLGRGTGDTGLDSNPKHNLTSPAVSTMGSTMLRLDRISINGVVASPFVKMSANCAVVGT
jgi:hypothetical protein